MACGGKKGKGGKGSKNNKKSKGKKGKTTGQAANLAPQNKLISDTPINQKV